MMCSLMNRKFHTGSAVIIIIAIVIFLSGLSSCKNTGDVSGITDTFEVARGDIIQTITTTGYVDSIEKIDYSVTVSGKVLHALGRGDDFNRGDVLIEIDNSRQELLIEQAEENLKLAENSLDLARLNYQQALDSNHIALQLAENSSRQSELSTLSALTALENANNMADKSRKSAEVALENAKKILAEAKTEPLITDTQIAQYETSVDSAQASYDSAVAQSRSSAESARVAYEQSILGESATYWSNFSSTQSAESQIKVAASNIEQSEAQLRLSEINLELAALEIDDNIIYAPYDGVVLSSVYKKGQYASPGINAISIISDEFIIKADINEIDVVGLEVGQDVNITLDAYYENEFGGKIIKIYPVPTNTAGVVSFEFLVEPETENIPRLIYGLTASLDITTSGVEDVLYVPIESVFEEDGKTYVDLVTENGDIEKAEVTTGTFNYDFIEIKSGLNEGDSILISPIHYTSAGIMGF
jgi:HlyD family secretion protein